MTEHPAPAGGRSATRLDPVTRKALLVEAAAEVFKGRDPLQVTIEEVAEAGGVSRSLVYAYFGDRGGLIAAVYLHNLERFDRELGFALDQALPDEVKLRRLVRRYLLFARDHRASWDLMVAAGALHQPLVQDARRARIERIASAWGDRPAGRLVARTLVGTLEAGAQDWIDYRDCGLERAVDVLVTVVWDGLSGLADHGILSAV
ncbi:MAG: TetR/AcrR family transcriptional regulator [Acidimicrobiales bacterium]